MKGLILCRLVEDDEQTTGSLVLSDNTQTLAYFSTLELDYDDNQKNISSIPAGRYTCSIRESEKYGRHLIVNDVPNRSLILLHYGNYNRDTKGCILIGEGFKKINSDKYFDVTNSRNSMKRFMNLIDGDISLTIYKAIIISFR